MQALKFLLVMGVGLAINTAIIYSITEGWGFDYKLSWLIATLVVTFWNFSFNRLWTFRVKF